MSTARGAKLKAQYNRVRTSTALRGNDMWTNTIGMDLDPQAGSNAAIEAAIYAPTHGGGGGRTQRRELAQQLIQKTGYQPSVTDYQGLLTLARAQGSLGVGTRGACKLCGGMGHLTKQCTNFLTGHNAVAGVDVIPGAAPGPGGAGPAAALGLLPDPEDFSDLSDLSSDSDSGSGSGSDSDSDRKKSSKKRKRSSKEKKSKEKSKKSKEKRKKHKKEKESKKSKKESKKRSRDSDSDYD